MWGKHHYCDKEWGFHIYICLCILLYKLRFWFYLARGTLPAVIWGSNANSVPFFLQFHQNISLLTIRNCFLIPQSFNPKMSPTSAWALHSDLVLTAFPWISLWSLQNLCSSIFGLSQIRSVSEGIMSYQMLPSSPRNTEISVHSLNLVRFGGVFQLIDCQIIFPKSGNTKPESVNSY